MKRIIGVHALFLCPVLTLAAEPFIDSPKVLEALKWGMQRLERKEYRGAVSEFKRAGKLAGGPCGPCQLGLARAYNGKGDWKQAGEAARAAIPLTDRPDALAQAYEQLGVALAGEGTSLAEAEAALRKALELGGTGAGTVVANLAGVLLRSDRHAEALDLARQALKSGPEGTDNVGARVVLCQAKRAVDPPFAAPAPPPEDRCVPRPDSTMGSLRLASGAAVPGGQEVTRPEKIFGKPPSVPPGLRGATRGMSVVSAIIDEEGCVRDIHVCEGGFEAFNQATSDAISRWVFKPATLEGAPVAVYYTMTTTFQVYPPS